METLITGGSFTAVIDEQIVFNQPDGNDNAIWSLLLATGYLKVLEVETVGKNKEKRYTLALTNKGDSLMFENMIDNWFKHGETNVTIVSLSMPS